MKIQNNQNKYLQAVRQVKNNENLNLKVDNIKTSKTKNVQIEISEKAKALSKAAEEESSSQRIEDIKAAIQNDTYEVSPEKIANGILREIDAQAELKEE